MTDYKTIHGKKIKFQTTDLTMSTATEGELFYSDSGKEFKVGVIVQTWASSNNLNVGRNNLAGFGIQTAAVACGGVDATAANNDTEEYNGSSWTAVEDMPAANYDHACTGTLTAGLSVGGGDPIRAGTLEYDGTDWAAGGGRPSISAVTAEYDGSSWTANPSPSGDLTAAIQYHRMTGVVTSAVSFGGGPSGPVTGATETYNGTVWTAQTATLNDTRSRLGGAGETDSSAMAFGGNAPGVTANTELWDGSSWTEVANMGTARYGLVGTGTKSTALQAGGYGDTDGTEEWSSTVTLKTVTDS